VGKTGVGHFNLFLIIINAGYSLFVRNKGEHISEESISATDMDSSHRMSYVLSMNFLGDISETNCGR